MQLIRFSEPVLRWQLTPAATKWLSAALLAGLAWGGWLAFGSNPTPAAPVVLPQASATVRATPTLLVVDVVGPVVHPGIVRVPAGSRIVDVIRAAGGLRTGATAGTNLARLVADGEQVVIGAVEAQSSATGSNLVDLNTAGVAELDALPRVGPVLAQRIIDWRDSHGRFSSVDELREIAGIGSSVFADLAKRVRV